MQLLGPTFLLVLVALVTIGGAVTMLLAMRGTIRRNREAAERRRGGSAPRS